jgi:hypothetical protein
MPRVSTDVPHMILSRVHNNQAECMTDMRVPRMLRCSTNAQNAYLFAGSV